MSTTSRPTVLVVGKDARTDAIASACAASPQLPRLFALAEMLIPGLNAKCEHVFLGNLRDTKAVIDVAERIRPDLAIIGPEEPLEAGFVDALRAMGVPAFGPSRPLARIEWSKSWARRLLDRYDIAGNPEYRVFDSIDGMDRYMETLGSFVVKPDGLTAGKGVRVFGEHLRTVEEAIDYAQAALTGGGATVQIEEKLEGQEFSLQTITDGEEVIHLPLVQDHKRAFNGDEGPNTGGMGSYSCADFSLPFLAESDVAAAHATSERVIDALARETGEPYRGVLYGGFIATRDGVRLIEYNSRFGDPEAMNVLPLLDGDFVELCASAAAGRLRPQDYVLRKKATVCKYIVPLAYPDPSPGDEKITIPEEYLEADDVKWFWAACEERGSDIVMTSSRAGAFIGLGDSLAEAEAIAERAAGSIGSYVRHRTDIGRADVIRQRVDHVRSLRADVGAAPAPEFVDAPG